MNQIIVDALRYIPFCSLSICLASSRCVADLSVIKPMCPRFVWHQTDVSPICLASNRCVADLSGIKPMCRRFVWHQTDVSPICLASNWCVADLSGIEPMCHRFVWHQTDVSPIFDWPYGSWWSCSYSSWIYNYICIHCLSPLKLRVWIGFMARCTRYNFM